MITKTRPTKKEIKYSFMALDILSGKRTKWDDYRDEKNRLPNLTPDQYEREIKRITEEMGI